MTDEERLQGRKDARAKSTTGYPIRWRYPAVCGDTISAYLALLFHEDGSITWDVAEFKEQEAETLDRMFGEESRPDHPEESNTAGDRGDKGDQGIVVK